MSRNARLTVLFHSLVLITAGCGSREAPAPGQDFASLAQSAPGYAQARPGQALQFPRDHGAHPDFRIEWWYLTANLQDPQGRAFGAQWTLFRLAVQPPGPGSPLINANDNQVYMAHFAVSTPREHFAFQRYSRGKTVHGEARSGVRQQPFAAWLDDWALRSSGDDWLPLTVTARQDDYSLRLQLESDQPIVLQGERGFSQKHPDGGGSFYYSQPFLDASGELKIAGKPVAVRGKAWLDREWSSQFLQADQVGWDWFSLHLDSGEKLMLFQLRQKTGQNPAANYRHGVLISPHGEAVKLNAGQLRFQVLDETLVAGRSLPLSWRIELPQIGRAVEISALHADQWMNVDFPYWEGAVVVSGDGPKNSGRGYMELTGYPVR